MEMYFFSKFKVSFFVGFELLQVSNLDKLGLAVSTAEAILASVVQRLHLYLNSIFGS